MKKVRKFLTSKATLVTGGITTAVVAPSAFAVTATETAINTAITNGETLIGLVAPGVITIAAIMLGVGLVVSWMRK